MTEQEMRNKIKESAKEVDIPESISAEAMREKLEAGQAVAGNIILQKRGKEERSCLAEKGSGWYRKKGKYAAVAAVAVLVGMAGTVALYQSNHDRQSEPVAEYNSMEEDTANINAAESASEESLEAEEQRRMAEPKTDVGELYVVAKNYGEVYDVLAAGSNQTVYDITSATNGSMEEGISVHQESMQKESAAPDYSKTNIQTEGVDESDIIKTDGSYIYLVSGDGVKIVDARETKMKKVGEIIVPIRNAAEKIVEMYVEEDYLNLIVQREESGLQENTNGNEKKDVQVPEGEYDREETTYICEDEADTAYYIDITNTTELLTYDITDRRKPVLKGMVKQEGKYQTSRKIGDTVYLFTTEAVDMPQYTREDALENGNINGWIPLVNGSAVAADCIYLPQEGNQGLLISSVNVKKPSQIVDNIMIMHQNVDIYVSASALYLYNSDYSGSSAVTQIAKFALEDGNIQAIGASIIPGTVNDTFAIHENHGSLRLLTTDWSGNETENGLYLLDEELNLTGKLEGIASGEEIYSARFLGDMAYFVTYRNTDPLFAVDLSDEKNPKILSELKITGFSEYLHFWGEDKLVGIGYETDPKTGEHKGIKLTMFDISDTADIKTVGTCVIENGIYSPALYNYKCVLVDEAENMIGFALESETNKNSYLLFSWENGNFVKLLTASLEGGNETDGYRGIYIGDIFYLADSSRVFSYDRTAEYRLIESLET